MTALKRALGEWASGDESLSLSDFEGNRPDLALIAVHAVAQLIREDWRQTKNGLLVPLPGANPGFGNAVGMAVDIKSLWVMRPQDGAGRIAQIANFVDRPGRIMGIAGILHDGMVEGFAANLSTAAEHISVAALWDRRTVEQSPVPVRSVFAGELLPEAAAL